MQLSDTLQTPTRRGSSAGKPDLHADAVEYLGRPEARTAELDGTLLAAVISQAASALGSDMRSYLRYARCIEALGYIGVYLVMPTLAYWLFIRDHPTLAIVAGLMVVAIHVVGAPYRCQDRRRANALLQHALDLTTVLDRRPVSMPELSSALSRACAAGMVLDDWVLELVQLMAASDEATNTG